LSKMCDDVTDECLKAGCLCRECDDSNSCVICPMYGCAKHGAEGLHLIQIVGEDIII